MSPRTLADVSDRELLETLVRLWSKTAKHVEVLNHEHEEMVTWRDTMDRWRGKVDGKLTLFAGLGVLAAFLSTLASWGLDDVILKALGVR